MVHAIIGNKGDMARNLLVPLLSQYGEVCGVDRESTQGEWETVWRADVIWVSVPREEISALLQGVRLKPEQLVVDICSVKRGVSRVIAKTGGTHLSLHPLHGPHVPLEGQKWVVVAPEGNTVRSQAVEAVLDFLKKRGVSFFMAASEDEHDFMIGVVLSIPEALTNVIDEFIREYAKDCGRKPPTMEELMKWAVPASNALFSFYIHSINSSAEWLRKDLILNAHGNLLKSFRQMCAQMATISEEKIEEALNAQHAFVSRLPQSERRRARQWIERWFADSTEKIFVLKRKTARKPNITIQYSEDKIFPSGERSVKVGIHGIEGCFTEESVLRFCEEQNTDREKLILHYLVTAERVIQAVAWGAADYGVFAVANSGSGAYVSSMHAMGAHQFRVRAVYGMEILQCLIAHPSVASLREIQEVFAHPQAVSQCKRTFAEKYPEIKLIAGEDSDDTALCVKRLAEGALQPTTATLASQTAAERYGMKILEYGMHHDPFNTTTFLVVSR